MFSDRILLITGGTGSFGNAVLNRFLQSDLREIRIFSRDEKKQDDMRKRYASDKLKFYIGDVRDYDAVLNAHARRRLRLPRRGAEAGAVLRVPSDGGGEDQRPRHRERAGSGDRQRRQARGLPEHRQGGLSDQRHGHLQGHDGKGHGRQVAQRRSDSTVICGTRYGNVMASRGSVIPLFVEQIQAGKPITITDPAMTRFMMTLDDAVDLVLYAFEHGENGDIFVQKAPAATIEVLAKALLGLLGKPQPCDQRDRHPPWREAVRNPAEPGRNGVRRGPAATITACRPMCAT